MKKISKQGPKISFTGDEAVVEIVEEERPIISFLPEDIIGDILGFNASTIYEEYNLSPNPVDILLFDNIFLECDIAQCMI